MSLTYRYIVICIRYLALVHWSQFVWLIARSTVDCTGSLLESIAWFMSEVQEVLGSKFSALIGAPRLYACALFQSTRITPYNKNLTSQSSLSPTSFFRSLIRCHSLPIDACQGCNCGHPTGQETHNVRILQRSKHMKKAKHMCCIALEILDQ